MHKNSVLSVANRLKNLLFPEFIPTTACNALHVLAIVYVSVPYPCAWESSKTF